MFLDLSNTEAQADLSAPMPAGRYLMHVTGSEVKPTAAGTGQRLVLEFTILEGDHKGRKVWEGYNIANPNAQAVEISKSQLKALLIAGGHPNPDKIQSADEFHGRPVTCSVVIEPARDGYAARNAIKGFSKPAGTNGTAPAQVAAAPNEALKAAAGF